MDYHLGYIVNALITIWQGNFTGTLRSQFKSKQQYPKFGSTNDPPTSYLSMPKSHTDSNPFSHVDPLTSGQLNTQICAGGKIVIDAGASEKNDTEAEQSLSPSANWSASYL